MARAAVSTPNPLALNDVLAADDARRARFSNIRDFREVGRAVHWLPDEAADDLAVDQSRSRGE